MELEKPLVFLDLETTGLDIRHDRIIEIALLRMDGPGEVKEYFRRLNPGIPIPADSTAIHGISDLDVADAPFFADVADEMLALIGEADLAGFNSNRFDVPLLAEEFLRCGRDFSLKNRTLLDVSRIHKVMEPRNLSATYRYFCGRILENAHSALADARATLEIFLAQEKKYTTGEEAPLLPSQWNVPELAVKTAIRPAVVDPAGYLAKNNRREIIINFGRYRGKLLSEIFQTDIGYIDWMLAGDFPLYTKKILSFFRDRFLQPREAQSDPAPSEEAGSGAGLF